MKQSIILTESHLKLISHMQIRPFSSSKTGIDLYDLYGGGFIYDDMSRILDRVDDIEFWGNDATGPVLKKEVKGEYDEMIAFIEKNIVEIMEIVQQFVTKGGVKPGKYVCDENVRIWEYKGEDGQTESFETKLVKAENVELFVEKVKGWCGNIKTMIDSENSTRSDIKEELNLLIEFNDLFKALNLE